MGRGSRHVFLGSDGAAPIEPQRADGAAVDHPLYPGLPRRHQDVEGAGDVGRDHALDLGRKQAQPVVGGAMDDSPAAPDGAGHRRPVGDVSAHLLCLLWSTGPVRVAQQQAHPVPSGKERPDHGCAHEAGASSYQDQAGAGSWRGQRRHGYCGPATGAASST